MNSKITVALLVGLSSLFFVCELSAQVASEPAQSGMFADGEQQYSRGNPMEPDADWTFTSRLGATYIFGGDVDDAGGEIDVAITQLTAGITGPGWRGSQISFGLNYEHRFYDFDFKGTEPFFGTNGDQDIEFNSIGATANIIQGFNKNWGAFLQAGVRTSAEVDADLGDGVTWNVFTGIGYRHSSDFMIGLGVGFLGRLEEDVFIIPALQMRWNFAEDWQFNIQGRGLSIVWDAQEDLQFTLGASFASRRFRLNDDSITNSSIFEDRRIPISLNAAYDIDENWRIDGTFGVDVLRQFIVEDRRGRNRQTFDSDPSIFFGLGVRATF